MEFFLPAATWRLIVSDPLPGPANMALDAAILEAVESGLVPATLRLYRWSPPCLSLGYSQPTADIDLARLRARGWGLVRRPTGGRAILHTDEITYAVIGPWSDPRLAGSLMDSYQRISRALYLALQALGLAVEIHQGRDPLAFQQPVCFQNPSDFEITAGGKKIIGSAQARKKGGLLQHGSLPLTGDLARITEVLAYGSDNDRLAAAEAVRGKAHTVSSALRREVGWEEAAQALIDSFQTALNLDLVPGQLTPQEQAAAVRLEETRYGQPDWTRGPELHWTG